MTILGIETSCDETAAAVVKNGREILSNVVASSVEMHSKTGGIIPEAAAREQVKSIIPVINESLTVSRVPYHDLDAVAVTIGPGFIGSLLVGVETVRTLAWVWKKPLVPVNHLVGHIYANWLAPATGLPTTDYSKNTARPRQTSVDLPAIALVVSGGHTDLVFMRDHGSVELIGSTRDDAAGECFDKCARLLGLAYPGGPAIAAEAAKYTIGNKQYAIRLPRPLAGEETFDFSFSGLKTAVLREANRLKQTQQFSHPAIQQLSFEIQEAITDVLVDKTLKAVKKYGAGTLLVAGGVAANSRLAEKFQKQILDLNLDLDLHIPLPRLCTDNAAMIAAAAFYNYKPIPWKEVQAFPGLHF